ncbi:hypothetical protein K0M31_007119 [Melipona bicolor]|uniref:Uncharacterized protein n=1 Tax=Melipona bicolor TaxID=60889 RepID=A0AA40FRM7_9HYME|nr:hypothetical protein K0M31_007119 [Melipona bicolor]
MSTRLVRKLLKNIQNVSEECSDGRNSESENEQIVGHLFDMEEIERDYMFDTDDEEENILNVRRGQKHRRFLSDSESESDQNIQNTEVVLDGTVWQQIKGPTVERSSYSFKQISGPTTYVCQMKCLVKQKRHFH